MSSEPIFGSIPESIEEAIGRFKRHVSRQDNLWDLIDTAEEFSELHGKMHMSGARQMRNQWGLWTGMMAIQGHAPKGVDEVPDRVPLVDEIHEKTGLLHADDLSGYLLRRIWNELRPDKPVDIDDWLEDVQEHWASEGEEELCPQS